MRTIECVDSWLSHTRGTSPQTYSGAPPPQQGLGVSQPSNNPLTGLYRDSRHLNSLMLCIGGEDCSKYQKYHRLRQEKVIPIRKSEWATINALFYVEQADCSAFVDSSEMYLCASHVGYGAELCGLLASRVHQRRRNSDVLASSSIVCRC